MGYVDKRFKKKIAYYVYHSQVMISQYMSDEGMVSESKDISDKAEAFRSNMLIVGIDLQDRQYRDILFGDRIPNDDMYEEWCWLQYYCLNPTNELPVLDDPEFKDTFTIQVDEVNRIRLDDIFRVFDHCRKILFWFKHLPNEEKYNCNEDPIQRLLDCYFRLYSILDKITKVLNDLVLGNNSLPYDDESYFSSFFPLLENNPNIFIKGIFEISNDINYSSEDEEMGFVDPFYSMHRVQKHPGTIRNDIDHRALLLINPEERFEVDNGQIIISSRNLKVKSDGVLVISARDLEVEIGKLLRQIRELLLNLELASNSGGLLNDKSDVNEYQVIH